MYGSLNTLLRWTAQLFPQDSTIRTSLAAYWTEFLKRHNHPIHLKMGDHQVRLLPQWRSFDDDYEATAIRSFLARLQPNDIVFDVGAHIGLYSLLAHKAMQPIRIYAFEPNPNCHSILRKHFELNAIEDGRILPYAVTDGTSKYIDFAVDETTTVTNRIYTDRQTKPNQCLQIPTTKLDDWAEKLGRAPDTIKMDVEGAELLALRGAQKLLDGHWEKRPSILLSAHPHFLWEYGYTLEDLSRFLTDRDYDLFDLNGMPAEITTHAEYWALPR